MVLHEFHEDLHKIVMDAHYTNKMSHTRSELDDLNKRLKLLEISAMPNSERLNILLKLEQKLIELKMRFMAHHQDTHELGFGIADAKSINDLIITLSNKIKELKRKNVF
jgi:hypothetical protein